MTARSVAAVDLFAGGGGLSSGLALACQDLGIARKRIRLVAINHWAIAVETHKRNHPWAEHLCASVEGLDPTVVVPSGRLDLVVAGPECTHFSVARGGMPKQDQKRASPWFILPWLSRLYVKAVLIENVSEFQSWGPLGADGQPLKRYKGETFKAFIHALQGHGYTVSYRVLNAADYGDATSRKRLFIIGRRGSQLVDWPRPTHSRGGKAKGTKRWRAAREIIDWSIEGKSIFDRKKPLAPATMRRILAGLEKFGGPELKPFLVVLTHGVRTASLEDPLPTVTGEHRGEMGIAEPFVLGQQSGSVPRSVKDPLPTIAAGGAISKVDAFILPQFGGSNPRNVDDPLGTITTTSRGIGLVEPFILPPLGVHHRDGKANKPRSIDEPLQTITRRGGGHLVSAHIQSHFGERKGQSPRVHSVEDPLPTITQREPALVEGILTNYHGNGSVHPIDAPVPTFGTKQQIGLIQPVLNGWKLDIRFRMLQPHELAGAMGFDPKYGFQGTREQVVRQIGNAVAVNMAKALCLSLLNGHKWGRR